jgi:thiol-disulfide isomerase/thioredoxin
MRLIHNYIVFFVIIVFAIQGCKSKTNTYTPTTTVIEGQITSAESPVLVLKGDTEYKSTIDPTGKFFIQTDLIKAGIYRLIVGYQSINIFIVPGDRISLIGDYRNINSVQFTGDHANENKYLTSYATAKETSADQDFQSFYGQGEDEFIKAVENRTLQLVTSQQEYQKNNSPFDEIFAELITEEISYDASIVKMNYPTYFEYLKPDTTLALTDTYDSFLQNIEVDSDEKLMIPSYHDFLPLYLDFKTKLDTTNTEKPLFVRKFESIKSRFQSPKVRELLYYQLLTEGMQMSINDVALVIDEYTKLQTNKTYNEEINTVFNGWRHLLAGKDAPSWEYQDLAGNMYSSNALKGKVVYIDIWATWCGPCLRELPYLEKMQEAFKGNNKIAFVSISIDQDKAAWQAMVKQKNMKGIQLLADQAWNSKIVSDYRINGIPRFIIVSKEGTIINANAPRPSDKELKNILEKAL